MYIIYICIHTYIYYYDCYYDRNYIKVIPQLGLALGVLTTYAEHSSAVAVQYFDARAAVPWVPDPFAFSLALGMLGARVPLPSQPRFLELAFSLLLACL